MDLLLVIIFGFMLYQVLKTFSPIHPFRSNSGFWTGFWTYIWSTIWFRGILKIFFLLFLTFFLFAYIQWGQI